jgi:hypothetical protein
MGGTAATIVTTSVEREDYEELPVPVMHYLSFTHVQMFLRSVCFTFCEKRSLPSHVTNVQPCCWACLLSDPEPGSWKKCG